MNISKIKKINLAIQGGGARGAFVWGILDRLLEDKRIEIEGISATSAGCMNAIVLSQGMMEGGKKRARELLHDFWKAVSEYGKFFNPTTSTPLDFLLTPYTKLPLGFFIFKNMLSLFSPYQLNPFDYNPLRIILKDMIDFESLKQNNAIKLFMCATNIKNGKLHVFSNEDLTVDVVLASACLPYLFQAVEIDNEYYWDGGYLGNPAIFPLIYQCKSQDILILHTSPLRRSSIPVDAFEINHRMTEITFNSSLMREMRAIAFVTKLIDENWIKDEYKNRLKKVFMHSMESDDVLQDVVTSVSRYNTDWIFLKKLFRLGRKTSEEWLAKKFDLLGNESTINFEDWS